MAAAIADLTAPQSLWPRTSTSFTPSTAIAYSVLPSVPLSLPLPAIRDTKMLPRSRSKTRSASAGVFGRGALPPVDPASASAVPTPPSAAAPVTAPTPPMNRRRERKESLFVGRVQIRPTDEIGSAASAVAPYATIVHMSRDVSVRELRNSTADVIAELEKGERLTLTVNRRPVADIVPHAKDRDPWVPSSELRRIREEAGADAGLLEDLADVRGAEIDEL